MRNGFSGVAGATILIGGLLGEDGDSGLPSDVAAILAVEFLSCFSVMRILRAGK